MQRKTLVITDVTTMRGDKVCIAGYDDSLTCIRPVLSLGQLTKRHLFKDGELIIFPSAKIEFNFGSGISQPPHVEDIIFEEASIKNMVRVSVGELRELLTRTTTQNVAELFSYIDDRCVPPGSLGPSIGTIVPADIPILSCNYYKDPPRPKMRFVDQGGSVKNNVPITDLAFRSLFDFYLEKYNGDCEKAVKLLNNKLAGRDIYLRLGLSRSFRGYCWLQVNGIHTFPYLYDRDYCEWIRLD